MWVCALNSIQHWDIPAEKKYIYEIPCGISFPQKGFHSIWIGVSVYISIPLGYIIVIFWIVIWNLPPQNISRLRVKNENMFEMHTMCKVAMSIIKLIFCRVIIIQLCISLSDQLVVGQKEGMPVCTTCNDEF